VVRGVCVCGSQMAYVCAYVTNSMCVSHASLPLVVPASLSTGSPMRTT
jgi:hypothetical protein